MSEQKILPIPMGGDVWYHFATQVPGDIHAKRYLFRESIMRPVRDALESGDRRAYPILNVLDRVASTELNAFGKILAQTDVWQRLIDDARRNPESLADPCLLSELEKVVHHVLNEPLKAMEASTVQAGVFDLAEDVFVGNLLRGQARDRHRTWEYEWEQAVAAVAERLDIETVYHRDRITDKFAFNFSDHPTPEDTYRYRRIQTAFSYAQIARFFQGKEIRVGRYLGERIGGSFRDIKRTNSYTDEEIFLNTAVFGRALETMDRSVGKKPARIEHAHTIFTSKIFEGFEDGDTEDMELLLTASLHSGNADDASYALGRALKIIVSDQNIAEYIICARQIPQYRHALIEAATTAGDLFKEQSDPRSTGVSTLIRLAHGKNLNQPERNCIIHALADHTKKYLRKKIYAAQIDECGGENTLMAMKYADTREKFMDGVRQLMLKTLFSTGIDHVVDGEIGHIQSVDAAHTHLKKLFDGFSDMDVLFPLSAQYHPPHEKTKNIVDRIEFFAHYLKLLLTQHMPPYQQREYSEKLQEFFDGAQKVGVTKEQLENLYIFVAGAFEGYAQLCQKNSFAPRLVFSDPLHELFDRVRSIDIPIIPLLADLESEANARFPQL